MPYTTAGCDFGAVATANTVLENGNAVIVSGGPTPLQAAVSPGDTVLKVGSVTGFGVGRAVNIGGADPESGTIAAIASDTAGGGPRLTLTAALTKAHPAGVNVWGTTSTNPIGDITKVFGENSPQWNEAKFSQTSLAGTADRNLAQTDFVGFAVHCAQGSAICANGQSDPLPDEPGGYTGYKGLFGAQEINPLLSSGGTTVDDLDGHAIVDPFGKPGFPGFDGMSASVSLSYVEKMQLVERRDYVIECNWKVYVDNYLEGYHLPIAHPGLFKELDYDAYRVETFRYYSKQHAPIRELKPGEEPGRDRRYIRQPGTEEDALYYWVFPNTMFNIYQDNMSSNLILPLGVDKTLTVFEWFFAQPGTGPGWESMQQTIAFSDQIQQEDIALCEHVQRGLRSRSYDRGRFNAKRENGVYHFQRLVTEFLS